MSLIDYVRSLEPVYERRQIRDSITSVKTELEDFTQPVLKDFSEFFRPRLLRAPITARFVNRLSMHVRFRGNEWFNILTTALDVLRKDLAIIDEIVRADFNNTIATDDISFNRANVLRFIELGGFYTRYMRKLMLAVTGEEGRYIGKSTPFNLSRGEQEIIDLGMDGFVRFTALLLRTQANFGQVMRSISDTSMNTGELGSVMSALGIAKTDPFALSGYGKNLNPIFSLGKAFAEWQVKRYQAAKEEKTSLQLRLQELREQAADGEPNAKLQQFITHTEGRIEKLDYNISQFEERNSLE